MWWLEGLGPWLLSVMGIIIVVPFYTLAERKVLSYMQVRKGPNKVSWGGVLQPVSDSLKLMVKEFSTPVSSSIFIFLLSPMLQVVAVCLCGLLFSGGGKFYVMGGILFLAILSVSTYFILGIAWSSNSKYCLLSALRIMSQVITYEVGLVGFFLLCFFWASSPKFEEVGGQLWSKLAIFWWVLGFVLFLMDSNRAPFDFAEGESELVSGFNTEYSSLYFAFISLSEYGIMVVSSLILGTFLGVHWVSQLWFSNCALFSFLWVRGSYPRFRYDLCMELSWKLLIPVLFLLLWVVFL